MWIFRIKNILVKLINSFVLFSMLYVFIIITYNSRLMSLNNFTQLGSIIWI